MIEPLFALQKNIVFVEPVVDGYTIYTKSTCKYCVQVKEFLAGEKIVEINVDEYLKEARTEFLRFIQHRIGGGGGGGKEYTTFPMVFHNGIFIGGYTDTVDVVNKSRITFDSYF